MKAGNSRYALALLLCVLSSCIGVSADIAIRRDGSGTIALEYRIAKDLDSLGALDGNAPWPPLPVGQGDFERTVARIQGLRMVSYQSQQDGRDVIYRATLEFADPQALIHFLDGSFQEVSLIHAGDQYRLSLSLGGGRGIDPDLAAYFTAAAEGYRWALDITLPSEGEFVSQNPASLDWIREGTRGRLSAPVADLLTALDPVKLEVGWIP